MTQPLDQLLIGSSPAMRELRAFIQIVAASHLPVLIEGETGTGKELVAAALHARSGRRGLFVAFNVCAIGDTMFEDALFGHVRGAFTGAATDAPGFLREADGGTAFFDEIGGLHVSLQAKLLRAIETGVFRPVGATHDVRSNFRLVAATNEPIDALVATGRFRSDLAHRLAGIVVQVPALADRPGDIPELVRHFTATSDRGNGAIVRPEALDLLRAHRWVGNVRELRQVVESAAVLAGGVIDFASVQRALASRANGHPSRTNGPTLRKRDELRALLEQCGWDTEAVAGRLAVHRATVYRRMQRLHIAPPTPPTGFAPVAPPSRE